MRTAGREGARARVGLSTVDYLTLFLIGLVVVLVSLPRLRRFALRENELDAIALLSSLGQDLDASALGLREGGLGGLLAANPRHESRFEDLELLSGGRLRRHGYLFDAQQLETGEWVLRGWPWEHGRTGLGSFVYLPGAGLYGNANEDAASDGPTRPPRAEPARLGKGDWPAMRP
ncbi:MAG: hypothetical protein IPJ19_01970 [Planctomycetes bacterium]|nr:hypothetical protein [Planctomycetota bacterium]